MLELLELELHVGDGRRTPVLCKNTKYLNYLCSPKQVPLVQRALDPLELVSTGLAHYTWTLKLKQFQVRETDNNLRQYLGRRRLLWRGRGKMITPEVTADSG